MSNVAEFLSALNEIKKQDIINIWIPSQQAEYGFTPLTVKQQKELLKASVEGTVGLVTFSKLLNQIIFDNSIKKDVDFLLTDKYPILIALRIASMGPEIKIDNKTYKLTTLPSPDKIDKKILTSQTEFAILRVEYGVPTLKEEMEIYNYNEIEFKKLKSTEASETVGILYTLELIKFINRITFNENKIDFRSLQYLDKKQIVENLPLMVNQAIVKYISSIRDVENGYITFSDEVKVPIDNLFFTTE